MSDSKLCVCAPDGTPSCGESWTIVRDGTYFCSRERGHFGSHVACKAETHRLSVWDHPTDRRDGAGMRERFEILEREIAAVRKEIGELRFETSDSDEEAAERETRLRTAFEVAASEEIKRHAASIAGRLTALERFNGALAALLPRGAVWSGAGERIDELANTRKSVDAAHRRIRELEDALAKVGAALLAPKAKE